MSKKSKERARLERKKLKQSKKAAKKALYLAQSKAGKTKGEHQQKKKNKNRYGKLWEKACNSRVSIVSQLWAFSW